MVWSSDLTYFFILKSYIPYFQTSISFATAITVFYYCYFYTNLNKTYFYTNLNKTYSYTNLVITYFYINLDIIFYILALVFFKAEVLYVYKPT